MKIKCIIIDDEPIAREGLAGYVKRTSFFDLVGSCKNTAEADILLQKQTVELVFLDIQMPEQAGIDWLKVLVSPPLVIITTAFRKYAVDGYELDVVDYLLKPFSFERFLKAANKALKQVEHSRNIYQYAENEAKEAGYIFIKNNSQFIRLLLDEILYIEGLKDYVGIHTKEKKYLALISLKNVQEKLPEKEFLRVHRSFIVSVKHIKTIEGNTINTGDREIPISKELYDKIYEKLIKDKLWKRGN
jgi:two-component system, LytTR family, response regulator